MKIKNNTYFLVFFLALSLLVLFFSLIFPSVSFSQPQTPLKIGVASMVTPVDTVKYYQEIIDYIGDQIKQPVVMVQRRTYDEMDALLERGEVKVAFICSAPYVKDNENFGVELLAAPKVNGSSHYHSYIIVHKDSPIKTFLELKGKVFAFTDPRSNTGRLYPAYLLKTMGYSSESFFKRYMYSYSHNKSVELVAKKVVDGAAVESLVYDYMVKKNSLYAKQTKVIKRSQPYGIPPIVATKDMDAELKSKIKSIFLNMHKTSKGKAILANMMIEAFVPISDREYNSVRKMAQAVKDTFKVVKKHKEKKTVYFGVIPRDNPRILYEKYQPLLDYLAEKTPYSYELVLKKNYEETVNALGIGEVDVAFLGPLTYLEVHEKYDAVCILKPKGISKTATYKSVIIKKKGSSVKKLSELKNKSIAFSAFKSTSGNLIPRYMLAASGIHLKQLEKYANFDFQDSVVKAVLKGQYYTGAVRDSVAKKYLKLGLEIIAESESIPTGPLVAGAGTPYSVIENIKNALFELNPNNALHQKVLRKLDEDFKNGFTEASDKDYRDIRAKINAVPTTCGIGCHPKIKL